jgi:hypothetical protein
MSVIVAKFKVNQITRSTTSKNVKQPDGKDTWVPAEMQTIVANPVSGNGDPEHENTKFWQATPSGKLELGCVNLEAAQFFELNEEYYVTFTKVKKY